MSRRHHGRPHHPAREGADGRVRTTGVSPSPAGTGQDRGSHVDQAPATGAPITPANATPTNPVAPSVPPTNGAPPSPTPAGVAPTNGVPHNGAPTNGIAHANDPRPNGAPANGAPGNGRAGNGAPVNGTQAAHAHGPGPGAPEQAGNPDRNGQCTAPQLRRFIKSRPYVPMHELRRRFGIDGDDDDVTSVKLDPGWVYVGLPNREGSLLGDLLRAGEIGYELSLDPRTPIVIGVYPMRPIPRG